MKIPSLKTFIISSVVVALVGTIVFVLPLFISSSFVKNEVTAYLSKLYNSENIVIGDVSFRFFPRPKFIVKDIKVVQKIVVKGEEPLQIKNVIGIFYKNRRESSAEEYTKKICGIKIGEIYATRGIVKHELYHIYKHHFFPNKTKKIKQKFLNLLKYLFVMESQATIYEVFGIKL